MLLRLLLVLSDYLTQTIEALYADNSPGSQQRTFSFFQLWSKAIEDNTNKLIGIVKSSNIIDAFARSYCRLSIVRCRTRLSELKEKASSSLN